MVVLCATLLGAVALANILFIESKAHQAAYRPYTQYNTHFVLGGPSYLKDSRNGTLVPTRWIPLSL
jgi:hypothetical protein